MEARRRLIDDHSIMGASTELHNNRQKSEYNHILTEGRPTKNVASTRIWDKHIQSHP